MAKIKGIEIDGRPCELCGHHFGQVHRLVPGCWGGTYDGDNCIWLCPNHHHGIHFMMACFYCQVSGHPLFKRKTDEQLEAIQRRLSAYQADPGLRQLWIDHVKQIVIARLAAEGRWYPYKRSLSKGRKYVIPR